MMNTAEQWLPMTEVAEMLHIPYEKLSRLVRQRELKTREDVLDKRVKLVEVNEVRRLFRLD